MKKSRMDAFDDLVLGLFIIAGVIFSLVILLILIGIFSPKSLPTVIREFARDLKAINT